MGSISPFLAEGPTAEMRGPPPQSEGMLGRQQDLQIGCPKANAKTLSLICTLKRSRNERSRGMGRFGVAFLWRVVGGYAFLMLPPFQLRLRAVQEPPEEVVPLCDVGSFDYEEITFCN